MIVIQILPLTLFKDFELAQYISLLLPNFTRYFNIFEMFNTV
ncbi:hypothetical protein SAMN05421542_0195 [Chryseobacterium jejuense]|uniref:Uncharacterized protein n=1 Tax=Chryseobacterium jejuense TaxID=445960 RepID=A0A2X2XEJ4_CHRJE|nr:hypothetical protein SAMN05421542_0195 [Chryseobacterium jejuense]SQB46465.1 Uncharacterised protein [Chryseobacterium jejuense]